MIISGINGTLRFVYPDFTQRRLQIGTVLFYDEYHTSDRERRISQDENNARKVSCAICCADMRTNMDNQKIGIYIMNLRKDKNMTQKELADLLGVTDKAVSKWERGAGYPDISLLRPLADALGTTINELLEGETAPWDITNKPADITNALEYVGQLIRQKDRDKGRLIAYLLAITLLISIFTCVIVNLAVNRELSWSYYVIDGCVMGGCLLIPPLVYKKKGFLISLVLLSIVILPFLGIIQTVTNTYYISFDNTKEIYGHWLWSIGFPISYTWIILLWLLIALQYKARLSVWFFSGICSLICIPAQAITNEIIYRSLHNAGSSYVRSVSFISSVIGFITAAGLFFILGLMKRKK